MHPLSSFSSLMRYLFDNCICKILLKPFFYLSHDMRVMLFFIL